jgi:predicted nucleic acid-binding protein
VFVASAGRKQRESGIYCAEIRRGLERNREKIERHDLQIAVIALNTG